MSEDLAKVGTAASVVSTAAKGASLLGLGAGTAAAAAIPVVGWAAAAVSIAAAIFGKKKNEAPPQEVQGFDVAGTLSKSGFRGTVTARDNLGQSWDASGERAGLEKFNTAQLITGNENISASGQQYYDDIWGDAVVPVKFQAYSNPGSLMPQLANYATQISDALTIERASQKRTNDAAGDLIAQLNSATASLTAPTIDAPERTTMEAPTMSNSLPAPSIPSNASAIPGTATNGGNPGSTGTGAQTQAVQSAAGLDPTLLIVAAVIGFYVFARG